MKEEFPVQSNFNIFIDVIVFYLQKSGGVSVVWKEIISRLKERCPNSVYLHYQRKPHNVCYDKIAHKLNMRILRGKLLKFQRYFPLKLKDLNTPFIFHSTYYRYCTNNNAINITTVHDFTYEYFTYGLKKWVHCWQKYKAIRKSKCVICVSQSTKMDLMKFLPDIAEDRIKVVYNGISEDYYPLEKWEKRELPFNKNQYLLFVGSRVAYKNFDFFVKSIVDTQYNLVIVGFPLTNSEKKILRGMNDRYYYAGMVPNSELNHLYNGTFALVYPSSYEGFGIPVLEAQKAGCPVIAYNASSIPEVIGDTPLLMKELTREELLRKLELLKSEKKRQTIILNGLQNVKRFSWDSTFEETMKVYKEAMNTLLVN